MAILHSHICISHPDNFNVIQACSSLLLWQVWKQTFPLRGGHDGHDGHDGRGRGDRGGHVGPEGMVLVKLCFDARNKYCL